MRSWLFVPGHDERKVRKALAADVDAVILDLEDAVPPRQKEEARRTALECLASADRGRARRVLRVNGRGSGHAPADVRAIEAALEGLDLHAVMLPKTRSADDVAFLAGIAQRLPERVIAMIESAAGIEDAREIARDPNVGRLAFGTLDYATDVRARLTPGGEALAYGRARLVNASRAEGIAAPLDGVYPRLDDPQGFQAECDLARVHGMGGKLLLHPTQIDACHGAFSPTADELERAKRILEAADVALADGRSAFRVDGEFVDPPVIEWARETLERAR